MITVKQIENCIEDKMVQLQKSKGAEKKKITTDIHALKLVRNYLETKPREDFVKKQLEDVQRIIQRIQSGYDYLNYIHSDKTLNYLTKKQAIISYNKKHNLKEYKQQERNLKLILG